MQIQYKEMCQQTRVEILQTETPQTRNDSEPELAMNQIARYLIQQQ